MNILTEILTSLDPHGEFAPVQVWFYYHNVVACMKQRCGLVSHLVTSGTNPSILLAVLEKENSDLLRNWKIPSYPPPWVWAEATAHPAFAPQFVPSPGRAVAVTLPFAQLRSFLKCYANERVRITVRHSKFQSTSPNSAKEGHVSLPSHPIISLT